MSLLVANHGRDEQLLRLNSQPGCFVDPGRRWCGRRSSTRLRHRLRWGHLWSRLCGCLWGCRNRILRHRRLRVRHRIARRWLRLLGRKWRRRNWGRPIGLRFTHRGGLFCLQMINCRCTLLRCRPGSRCSPFLSSCIRRRRHFCASHLGEYPRRRREQMIIGKGIFVHPLCRRAGYRTVHRRRSF